MSRRKNHRKSKMNVMTGMTVHVAGIIATLVVMVVVNIVADARCSAIQKSIGDKEKVCEELEKDRQREQGAWDAMTTRRNIDKALARHGLKMGYAKDELIVRMDEFGRPKHGQPSVRLALQRRENGGVVVRNSPRKRR